ncbi:hypothetical protein L218DRAFT_594715 [Marasmius fiardii PR-910]|nr:hypothetical protein L218DRAFT_594715 [Marasmius fiardii PR-910]
MELSFSSHRTTTYENIQVITKDHGAAIPQVLVQRRCKGTGCCTMLIPPMATCASCRRKRNEKKRALKEAQKQVLKNITENTMNTQSHEVKTEGKTQKRQREEGSDDHATSKKEKFHGINVTQKHVCHFLCSTRSSLFTVYLERG